jgi:hypothetical protein
MFDKNKDDKSITLGEYILIRLKEENLTLEDLDADTIDFFYQQWLIESDEGNDI